MKEFKNWKDIRVWFETHGYKLLSDRMVLNDAFWNCSGEFGRSQVYICDSMRYCETEEEREEVAKALAVEYSGDELHEIGIY